MADKPLLRGMTESRVRQRKYTATPGHWYSRKYEWADAYMPVTESGCWIWLGMVNHRGYGEWFDSVLQKKLMAHRVSYAMHRGPIPQGMHVCHRCDVPACVNPDHLFVGTHQDNIEDKVRKGRQSRGEGGNAKLTAIQVLEIRQATDKRMVLARRYGVHLHTIASILDRESWRHI